MPLTGSEVFQKEPPLSNPRKLAFDLLMRVKQSDSYINLLLPKVLAGSNLAENDRGLIQELSYGALRWQRQYDAIIDHFTVGKVLSDELRICLQLGLHQLFRMRIPPHAALNETVNLVKQIEPKASGLANAVLRRSLDAGLSSLLETLTKDADRHTSLAITYSHPNWVVLALEEALKLDGRADQLEALLAANNETPVVNLVALDESASKELAERGLTAGLASPIAFELRGNPESLISSSIRVQDQGSQLVALVLTELMPPGADVLDMCSGPGGKSAVLQSRIGEGTLTCMEPNPARAKLVADALGAATKAKIVVAPGQTAPRETFDAVLLDAPCSGIGSLRRKPESRWRKTPAQLSNLVKTQRELLDSAVNALRPDGVLLYSTCSPVVLETNTQIAELLARHPDLELIDLVPMLNKISPQLKLNKSRKTVQLWTQLHQTDAMFLAALRKK